MQNVKILCFLLEKVAFSESFTVFTKKKYVGQNIGREVMEGKDRYKSYGTFYMNRKKEFKNTTE